MLKPIFTAFVFIAALAAPILAAEPKPEPAMNSAPIDPRIAKVFAGLEGVWRTRDFKPMRGFWAKDLAAPLYLPEEKKDFITTWAGFDAYFANAGQGSRGGKVTYKPLVAMPMGEKMVMVAFEGEWTTHLKTEDAPIGGSIRGVALMEDDGTDWKFKAYIEAPLAPILYMRELYKLVAKERGFKAE
ncbi:MAG: hypothetical protein JNK21_01835 [Rhodospirillaceae bacterium]|nr:hypothetical protein [Rhodospirillaceae bacterium]